MGKATDFLIIKFTTIKLPSLPHAFHGNTSQALLSNFINGQVTVLYIGYVEVYFDQYRLQETVIIHIFYKKCTKLSRSSITDLSLQKGNGETLSTLIIIIPCDGLL